MESYLQFKRSSMRLEESSIHDPSSRVANNKVFNFSQSPGDSLNEKVEEESENENIEESEDQEEKTLSKQRKLKLMQNN